MPISKSCFKCGEKKDITEFYRHAGMSDGRLGKCKTCTQADVKSSRAENIEYYRAYDRKRGNRQTSSYRKLYSKRYKRERPLAYIAGLIFFNALRRGEIKKENCIKCGSEKSNGHHEDYRKPLDIIWLCPIHHRERHNQIKLEKIDLHYK